MTHTDLVRIGKNFRVAYEENFLDAQTAVVVKANVAAAHAAEYEGFDTDDSEYWKQRKIADRALEQGWNDSSMRDDRNAKANG